LRCCRIEDAGQAGCRDDTGVGCCAVECGDRNRVAECDVDQSLFGTDGGGVVGGDTAAGGTG